MHVYGSQYTDIIDLTDLLQYVWSQANLLKRESLYKRWSTASSIPSEPGG